jgi:hypothetical protein
VIRFASVLWCASAEVAAPPGTNALLSGPFQQVSGSSQLYEVGMREGSEIALHISALYIRAELSVYISLPEKRPYQDEIWNAPGVPRNESKSVLEPCETSLHMPA